MLGMAGQGDRAIAELERVVIRVAKMEIPDKKGGLVMKGLVKTAVSSLILMVGVIFLAAPSVMADEIYVRAGALAGGDGSENNPYNWLADVEANSAPGDEIVVLYSAFALDGGITLKDDQELEGELGPFDELPVISNTLASNDGVGVILATNNEIDNLHITDTLKQGISGVNMGDLRWRIGQKPDGEYDEHGYAERP